jgi:hypothetical protein
MKMAGALSFPNGGGVNYYMSAFSFSTTIGEKMHKGRKRKCSPELRKSTDAFLMFWLLLPASSRASSTNWGRRERRTPNILGFNVVRETFSSQPIFIRDDAFQQPTFRCEFILWFDTMFRIAQIKIITRHCLALEMNKHTLFAAALCCLFLAHSSSIIPFAGLNNCNFL